jgi:hypothetical protein
VANIWKDGRDIDRLNHGTKEATGNDVLSGGVCIKVAPAILELDDPFGFTDNAVGCKLVNTICSCRLAGMTQVWHAWLHLCTALLCMVVDARISLSW